MHEGTRFTIDSRKNSADIEKAKLLKSQNGVTAEKAELVDQIGLELKAAELNMLPKQLNMKGNWKDLDCRNHRIESETEPSNDELASKPNSNLQLVQKVLIICHHKL